MKAIIMDGGQGARLSPLTSSQPKPTIRIAIPVVACYPPLSIGEAQLSEVQVFVTSSLVNSAQAKLDELGIPSVHRLNESEWIPRATYETRYLRRTAR